MNQHESGAKLDDGKIDMGLLLFLSKALTEVSRVMSYGQVKYTRGGFLDVPDGVNRYTAAMLRHLMAEQEEKYDQDPWYDTEKGKAYKDKVRHAAQVACNALFRLELMLREEASTAEKIASAVWDGEIHKAKPGGVIEMTPEEVDRLYGKQ